MAFLTKLLPKWAQRSQEVQEQDRSPRPRQHRADHKAKRKVLRAMQRESRRQNRGQAVGFNSARRHK